MLESGWVIATRSHLNHQVKSEVERLYNHAKKMYDLKGKYAG
jgi:hypothetical protein